MRPPALQRKNGECSFGWGAQICTRLLLLLQVEITHMPLKHLLLLIFSSILSPDAKNIIEWQNTLGIKSEHWLCLFDNLLPFQLGIDCLFTIQNHTIPCNSVNDWLSVCTRQQLVVRRIRCVCSPIRKIEREILNTYIFKIQTKKLERYDDIFSTNWPLHQLCLPTNHENQSHDQKSIMTLFGRICFAKIDSNIGTDSTKKWIFTKK